MYWTRERDLRILAGLHWAMQLKAERHAAFARELLEQGCDALPDFAVEDHEAEMRDCRRIAKVLYSC